MVRPNTFARSLFAAVLVSSLIGVALALGVQTARSEEVLGYKCSQSGDACIAGKNIWCWTVCLPEGCDCSTLP